MTARPVVTVDIVSDVVCPWCVIGWKKLETAMARFADQADFSVAWHAFELNRNMPPEGEDIADHMARKYGASPEQSKANRARLTAAAAGLGFTFNMSGDRRIYNTFDAHRLLSWASESGHQTALKMALFAAYFTDGKDVSNHDVLANCAAAAGLDAARAHEILASDAYTAEVRAEEAQWEDRFITGVPAFIFNGKYMVPGAQDPDVFAQIIENKLLVTA